MPTRQSPINHIWYSSWYLSLHGEAAVLCSKSQQFLKSDSCRQNKMVWKQNHLGPSGFTCSYVGTSTQDSHILVTWNFSAFRRSSPTLQKYLLGVSDGCTWPLISSNMPHLRCISTSWPCNHTAVNGETFHYFSDNNNHSFRQG